MDEENRETDPFERFIAHLDMGEVDGISRATFHPRIEQTVKDLLADTTSAETMWTDRLTSAECQFRACASKIILRGIRSDQDVWQDNGDFKQEHLSTPIELVITLTLLGKPTMQDYERQGRANRSARPSSRSG